MKIRFAIVGTNWITERFIEAARKVNDFELTAVYSRTEERAKEFATPHQIPYTFTHLEELAKSDEVDAVYLASPNSLHAQQAVLLMNHGKHILCEKPMASNKKEVQQMIEAAKQNNVLLMEAMKSSFLPGFQSIQQHLHKIGQVRFYFANFCQYSSRYDAFKEGTILNAFKPEFSNGSLMDIGVYALYPLVVLFGKPESIKASGHLLHSGVDGGGSLLLHYKDKEAVIVHSKITSSALPSEIQGEEGTMIIDRISEPGNIQIRYKDGTIEDLSEEAVEPTMYYEVEAFIQLLQAGKTESPINSLEHSLTTIEIIEEARQQIGIIYPADKS
ncbi:Gfo/Idh/MocA family protein [Halalkalibacterium ligniniphilum]|uniref:Gfo/Idh/MocA family protein n=1 Tax=Halalkalibacterium ligniniphilum TaxID=1134413 RepID=UPI00034C844E|nr:Gfo/Idh/MocA family oxidoreductase [Halalkalibacterium ligniniphilum]